MRIRTGAFLAFSVIGFLAIVSGYFTPLHVTLYHSSADAPAIVVRKHAADVTRRSVASDQSFTIENTSGDTRLVQLVYPEIFPGGPHLIKADFHTLDGDWHEWEIGGRLISNVTGSRVEFHNVAADLELPFVIGPHEGSVRVVTGSESTVLDLSSPTEGFKSFTVYSPRRATLASSLYRFRALDLTFKGLSHEARVDLTIANMPFITKVLPVGEASSLTVSGWQIGLEICRHYAVGFLFVGMALVSILILGMAGYLVFHTKRGARYPLSEIFVVGSAVAFTLYGIVATSLSYPFSGQIVTAILGPVFVGAVLTSCFLISRNEVRKRMFALRPRITLGDILVLTGLICGLFVAYWPAFHVGDWFLGLLRTDAYSVVAFAESARTESLDALNSFFGHGMRVIDLIVIGQIANILHTNTRAALLVTVIITHCLTVLLSYVIARRLLGPSRTDLWAAGFACLVSFWAPYGALYMESYMAQYILTFCLYFSFAAGILFLQAQKQREHVFSTAPDVRILVVSTVFCFSLYPYFAFVPIAAFGAALLQSGRRILAQPMRLAAFVASGLLLANLNLFVFFRIDVTGLYVGALNDIARYIVFPFYKTPRFFAFLFGASPFHFDSVGIRAYASEFTEGRYLFTLLDIYVGIVNSGYFLAGIVCLLCACYVCGVRSKLMKGDYTFQWFAALLYGEAILVLGLTSQTYAYAKLFWTFSTLFPCLAVIPLLQWITSGTSRCNAGTKKLALLFVLVLAGTNVVSLMANNLPWFGNVSGVAGNKRHTIVVKDLIGIEEAIAKIPSVAPNVSQYTFSGPGPFVRATDHDRVLMGQTDPMFHQVGIRCMNCYNNAESLGGYRSSEACNVGTDLVVSIAEIRPPCAQGQPLYQGEYISLYWPK